MRLCEVLTNDPLRHLSHILLGNALVTFFAGAIGRFMTDRVFTACLPKGLADVNGEWTSTFTWSTTRDHTVPTHAARQDENKKTKDTIAVKQVGRSVSGKSITGDYTYKFHGRFVDPTLLVGEWKGLKNPLLGPFQIRFVADDTKSATGYWIGNGAEGVLFHLSGDAQVDVESGDAIARESSILGEERPNWHARLPAMLTFPMRMLLLAIAGWLNQEQRQKIEFLQEQVGVLLELHGAKRLRFNNDQRRRLAAKGKGLGRRVLRELGTIVTPDTILRWHRELIARKYDSSDKRLPGRPRIMDEVRALVVRMAAENERWGYTRIVGELSKLRHTISRSSVRRILKEHGVEPARERLKHMPWSKFLKAHWNGLAAADFFTIEVWTKVGLIRYTVLFVIDLPTRSVEVAGIAPVPSGLWMEQIARNLMDEMTGMLRGKTHLIHDRDPLFTKSFREMFRIGGVESVRLPPKSPNLNAYAERFVLSIKSECLDRMILVGERHLRRAVDEYMAHYHLERTHQGLGNDLIDGVPECSTGPVMRLPRLGGLLNSYYREAA